MKALDLFAPNVRQALGAVALWALAGALGGGLLSGVGLALAGWWAGAPPGVGALLGGAGAGGFLAAQIGLLVRYLLGYRTPRPAAPPQPVDLVNVAMMLILLACLLYWLIIR